MGQQAPPEIMRGALRVLYIAAIYTRNWTLKEPAPVKQINDLWEAVHEIPSVLVHWRGVEEFERDLELYLKGYNRNWKSPDLLAIYKQAKESNL